MLVESFDTLPKDVKQLREEISELKSLVKFLISFFESDSLHEYKEWMDINELCKYHPEHPQKSTVYSWVHKSQIPFHKRGKKLLFLRSEIQKWLLTGCNGTQSTSETIDMLMIKKQSRRKTHKDGK